MPVTPESKPTKALTVFLTGATAWAGMYLAKPVAGAIAVVTATLLVFVVPNNTKAAPWDPPAAPQRLGHMPDAGGVDGVGLVVVVVLLLILCRIFGLL